MSIIDDFRAYAISHLQVTASTPIPNTPPQINVGESFAVTFTITNTDASLTFRNVRLVITSTIYAVPVPMLEVPVQLGPGQHHSHTFVFNAKNEADYYKLLPDGHLIFVQVSEPYARVTVHGNVDVGDLTNSRVFRTDIRQAAGA